jgi:hypothetical protein
MVIKSLYRDYFQKSKVFLYPLLDIRRGGSITPIQTYFSWENHYKPEDTKFICLYYLRDDMEFRRFEKQKLLGNKYFFDFKIIEENKGVYIFDYKSIGESWDNFVLGRYSKLSADHKKKIKTFYSSNNSHYAYVESYLHPERYFRMYADMLNVNEEVLKSVGELCSKPDYEKEKLLACIKNLEISI